MIVRIATENQYRLADDAADRLNELDNEAVAAAEAGDEQGFQDIFGQMLDLVASDGKEIDDEELVESDVILPPPDTSLDEAGHEFTGEGLIPD